MKLHTVTLSVKERKTLTKIVTTGTHPAQVFVRAQILLKAHRKLKDEEISAHLDCTPQHVARIRKRYRTEGIERALYDAPRSGKPPTFTQQDKTRIVAIACTDAPEGSNHWTGQLLAEKAVETGIVPKISKQTIWLLMKQHDLKPWREKNVVHSETHSRV